MPRRDTEREAEYFIRDTLKEIGWDMRNPLRDTQGQVFTQTQCLEHDEIRRNLNRDHPEFIVKLNETNYWIIEAKPNKEMIEIALTQAKNKYADKINQSTHIKAVIITGVAGNEDEKYTIRSMFFENGRFKDIKINEKVITSLISPKMAEELLRCQKAEMEEMPIEETFFLKTAEKINEILHNGAIPAIERGKIMSALLLSLIDDTPPNLNSSPGVLISEINARVNAVLQRERKAEFYNHIKITLPTITENHVKYKLSLVKTIQELTNLNIRSAMNSGEDILGKFYEIFLKYGNWAKEIGIVLTPRHITKFASEILDIKYNDIIYDPTCGTGGFLVAAFDYVKGNSIGDRVDNFKENNIFGIEQQPSVVALAIVNMIFRGDGKNNIIEADCFHKYLNLKRIDDINTAEYMDRDTTSRNPPITKVLMNPPFALKEKLDKEYRFVNHALKQMQRGGLLFTVLPISEMLQKGQYKTWRTELLQENTLLSVITFPPDLFYPIGVNSCGVIIKKGISHPTDQKVLWLRVTHDGFVIRKGKRLEPKQPIIERNMFDEYKEKINAFIINPEIEIPSIPHECKAMKIDYDDASLELVPEVYLDEKMPTHEELAGGVEDLVRLTSGFLLTTKKQSVTISSNENRVTPYNKLKLFKLTDLCVVKRKYAPYINELLSDQKITPYVTTTENTNGISIKCDTEPNFKKDAITVSLDGTCGATFYQFDDFISGEKTAVLTPKLDVNIPDNVKPHFLFYIAYIIRYKSWRYHYGRKLSETRLKKFEVPIPVKEDDSIDFDYIKAIVENSYSWEIIKKNVT